MKRIGRVSLYDATLSICEEPVNPKGCGLPAGYEEEFTNRVFKPLISFLRKRGFEVTRDPEGKHYKCIAHWMWQARLPVKLHRESTTPVQMADLQARLRLSGRTIELGFYQNVASEHPAGGYFDFLKFSRMPHSMQQRFLIEIRKIAAYLCEAHGYEPPSIATKRGGHEYARIARHLAYGDKILPTEDPLAAFNDHWNSPGYATGGGRFKRDETGWPAPSEHSGYGWNGGNRDCHGTFMEPGAVRYWIDYKGYVLRGRAYTNMNSMSIFVYGPGPRDYSAMNSQELFVPLPGRSLRKVKGWRAGGKLKGLLAKAVERQDFEKAIILRDELKKREAKPSRPIDYFGTPAEVKVCA